MKFMGHEPVAFVRDKEDPKEDGADWYRCSCGGTFGRREWVDHSATHIGPTFEEHVLQALGAPKSLIERSATPDHP